MGQKEIEEVRSEISSEISRWDGSTRFWSKLQTVYHHLKDNNIWFNLWKRSIQSSFYPYQDLHHRPFCFYSFYPSTSDSPSIHRCFPLIPPISFVDRPISYLRWRVHCPFQPPFPLRFPWSLEVRIRSSLLNLRDRCIWIWIPTIPFVDDRFHLEESQSCVREENEVEWVSVCWIGEKQEIAFWVSPHCLGWCLWLDD